MTRAFAILSIVLCILSGFDRSAVAQVPTTPNHNPHNTYGSPLDTIMSTRLWTDTAPADDFVRETRPVTKDLEYTPLTGTDPQRPKPRDKANLEALRAELEHDVTANEKKGGLRHAAAATPGAKTKRETPKSAPKP